MKIVKRNVYVSEFQDWPYGKRLAYMWLSVLLWEEPLETTLNPLDWSLRTIIQDIWTVVVGVLVLVASIFVLPYLAHRLKTKYIEYDPTAFIRDEYVLE